ncbi:universal stress protein [Lentilactobacillus sp. TOM.63]|uniref:universal stress protein n=1 Tax=Lentilactobacillus sp. TOM.63 TaxID=3055077 RepID=UPI00259FEFE3|nr:universal stress protein [Lentilactobacillus sp. TOM.63]MDM7516387.1 universal stress protein [Lentilactobacillus sp. TOM.63]
MYETILVPVDGSENSKHAVGEAATLSAKFGSTLQIVSVSSDQRYVQYGVTLGQDVMETFRERGEEILADAKQQAEKAGAKAETHFVVGVPKVQISKELPEKYGASLIVMGKSGVNGISRAILGSTTAYVVRHSQVNVMVIDQRA